MYVDKIELVRRMLAFIDELKHSDEYIVHSESICEKIMNANIREVCLTELLGDRMGLIDDWSDENLTDEEYAKTYDLALKNLNRKHHYLFLSIEEDVSDEAYNALAEIKGGVI